MLKTTTALLFVLIGLVVKAQSLTQQDYVNRYKDDAIRDMVKTRVPASITLAQGLLESESGNSDLARLANNHFGIKCHKEWSGSTYHKDDDERQECFRKYNSVLESYDDHSDFLKTRERYAFLFNYEITDYKSWAYGLKKAGYATNPQYAHKLIGLIENLNLNRFDDEGKNIIAGKKVLSPVSEPVAQKKDVPAPAEKAPVSNIRNVIIKEVTLEKSDALKQAIYYAEQNNVKYIISKKGDSWLSIAKENEMMLWQVLKYNDAEKDDRLDAGTLVYLKPKRAAAKKEYHILQQGETLRDVSQLYAIKLNHLYKNNKLEPGTSVQPGTKIYLNESNKM